MHLAPDTRDAIGVERGNMYQVTVASLNSLTEKDENTFEIENFGLTLPLELAKYCRS